MDKKTYFFIAIALIALIIGSVALVKIYNLPSDTARIDSLQNDLTSLKTGLPPTWGGWPSNGYMIRVKDGPVIYVAGDTDLMINWDAIREYYHPDIVISTDSVIYQMGLNEWVYAINKIKPKYVLTSHYGSFPFYPKTDDEFVKAISEQTSSTAVKLPAPGQAMDLMGLKITWLGHSAFIIETASGSRIGLDPEWHAVNTNNFPNEFKTAEKYNCDLILITHGHYDHFDPPALQVLMQPANGRIPAAVMLFELAAYARKLLPEYTNQIAPVNLGTWIGKDILEQAYGGNNGLKMTHLDDVEFTAIFSTHSSGVFSPIK